MSAPPPVSEAIDTRRPLRELLQSLAIPCLLLDSAGTVLLGNPAAEALGHPLWPTTFPQGWSKSWAVLRDGLPPFPQSARITPPVDLPGRTAIASRLELDDAEGPLTLLQLPPDETERAMQLASAAHDIRTDLQTIIAASELLTQNPPPSDAETARLQASIGASAAHALEQVNASLELSRLEFLQQAPRRDFFRLGQVVKETAGRLAPLADKAGLTFWVTLPEDTRLVEGQAHPIVALTQNLLSNAFKFTREGSVSLSLTETANDATNQCAYHLTIEDTGDGFPATEQDRLLTPFQTGTHHPPSRTTGTGIGIGTYLVQQAVRALDAQLEITAPAEGGTRFSVTFSLPLAADQQEPDSGIGAAHPPEAELTGLHILLVEDNDTNRALFLRTLSQAGATVQGAADGQDALTDLAAGKTPYDLVLLDLTMAGLDGIALATRLLLMEPPHPVPRLVALTGQEDDNTRAACRILGMQELIGKPVRPSELRQKIAALIDAPATTNGRPAQPLAPKLVAELIEDMGEDIARSLMLRALNEASALFTALTQQGVTPEGRNAIHSALGSSGLTGLAAVEFALRVVQAVSRIRDNDSPAMTSALALLQRAIDETRDSLSIWPPAARQQ
ncbi:ATP-binding response regulator [Pseudodonghicola xiamenensis]|uniref:histidine kinase n=1 Tax=Pseudodonghicola xiamenensis TaxID=337702 RepID=A0A8J3HCB1_9RHOB|nr:hybrid sensor histidine kinase/response regulator [Pseudodonghicola xiamenensis]GHH03122.1 hypothetical protein GCM10010961_41090 [Pseudodonghicola xiamenensis]